MNVQVAPKLSAYSMPMTSTAMTVQKEVDEALKILAEGKPRLSLEIPPLDRYLGGDITYWTEADFTENTPEAVKKEKLGTIKKYNLGIVLNSLNGICASTNMRKSSFMLDMLPGLIRSLIKLKYAPRIVVLDEDKGMDTRLQKILSPELARQVTFVKPKRNSDPNIPDKFYQEDLTFYIQKYGGENMKSGASLSNVKGVQTIFLVDSFNLPTRTSVQMVNGGTFKYQGQQQQISKASSLELASTLAEYNTTMIATIRSKEDITAYRPSPTSPKVFIPDLTANMAYPFSSIIMLEDYKGDSELNKESKLVISGSDDEGDKGKLQTTKKFEVLRLKLYKSRGNAKGSTLVCIYVEGFGFDTLKMLEKLVSKFQVKHAKIPNGVAMLATELHKLWHQLDPANCPKKLPNIATAAKYISELPDKMENATAFRTMYKRAEHGLALIYWKYHDIIVEANKVRAHPRHDTADLHAAYSKANDLPIDITPN